MLVNVAQLLKEGIGATRRVEIGGVLRNLDENNPGPTSVAGQAQLVRTPKGVLVVGQARLRMVQACRRCLELAQHEVSFAIEEEFVPSIDIITGAKLPVTDEDGAELVIDEHHLLDMTEVLRQLALAAGEVMGLCRADCRGLCPRCGRNLNLGACDCDTAPIDTRLAVLAKLLRTEDDQV